MLEYIILGMLMQKEMSGYDLKQWMGECTSYFFDASFGSIYPALKRMEQKGYIVCRESVEDSKFKKLYSITDIGKKDFLDWLEQPIEFVKANHSYLVRIYFYHYLPLDVAIRNLKDFIIVLKQHLDQLNRQKQRAENMYSVKGNFAYSTIICGIHYFEAILTWCNGLVYQLEDA
ncbi:PadR family transcriptional regulator [Clostridium minihomine]|uniref:PadR family transcriptional regulator n=1 Tax=Clostridium minihomine TaxID=2045012 RepID=UPI000C7612AD|nr:helix-turn-helix transcriptional regulator [Clostridium minihomine]